MPLDQGRRVGWKMSKKDTTDTVIANWNESHVDSTMCSSGNSSASTTWLNVPATYTNQYNTPRYEKGERKWVMRKLESVLNAVRRFMRRVLGGA
jgi:hypothetical protein